MIPSPERLAEIIAQFQLGAKHASECGPADMVGTTSAGEANALFTDTVEFLRDYQHLRGVAWECGTCGGDGEVWEVTAQKQQFIKCPNCAGIGLVSDDDINTTLVPCPDCTTRSPARMTEEEREACRRGSSRCYQSAVECHKLAKTCETVWMRPQFVEAGEADEKACVILRRLAGDGGGET